MTSSALRVGLGLWHHHAVNAPPNVATVARADPSGQPAWFALDSLGSRRATLAYWGAVALVVGALFVTRLLPCVDYPQHLALSDVARRLADPAAPERDLYQLNYFTYNGLFHILVARLGAVIPIELAGRLVVAASLTAMAGAVLALVKTLRRPTVHAALFTPILFSFSVGWGFANYVLATAIAAWTLVFVARAAMRPSVVSFVAVTVLGLLCAFAHVLAMIILCLAAAALALELGWRSVPGPARPVSRSLRATARAVLAAGPLLAGCVYCVAVYRMEYAWNPGMYRDPTIEGSSPPLWEKVVWFGAFATDLFKDASDQVLLWTAVAVMGFAVYLARRDARRDRLAAMDGASSGPRSPVVIAPFVVLTVAYFATPMVLIGTHLIFPRLAQWVVLGAVLALPAFPRDLEPKARRWMLALGLATGVNTVAHCLLFSWETNDASQVIDDLPPGGAATAVIWEPGTLAFRNGMLTHMAAYYAARKHGEWAFGFARYLSVPVRFKEHAQPAWPAHGWEFNAEAYDPRCKYARAFPLVIVRAPRELPRDASGEFRVRQLVFGRDADAVKVLSHHGRFWAFDTTGLPDDGTL
jgi:hypothetical protein